MDKKQSKKVKKTDLSITLIIIIGLLAVVNFFSYQVFYRWDLTQNKIFSISSASKKTARELNDIVNIKAYFSANLPTQVLSLKQEVADLLNEYQNYSNGKIRVEFIDPLEDESLQQELMMIGIPQLTFEIYEKDKRQLVNGYMGIGISFGDKTEAIPAIKQGTTDLEYQLTTAIKKVTSDDMAIIGYVASNGTADADTELRAAFTELEDLYTVRKVDIAGEEAAIPLDIDTLLLVGPTEEFNDAQLKAINAFMLRGGSLLALVDGVSIGEGLTASKNSTGLNKLIEKYGLKINEDLVADVRSGIASFSQGFFTFSSNYAFWPKINNEGFDQENASVANLENVVMPWASSVEIVEGNITENVVVTKLAFTTNQGWRVPDNFNVAPSSASSPQGEQKSYTLAASVIGNFTDAYPEDNTEATEEAGATSRMIVVGDSDFIKDGFLRNNPDNLTMFQNLVDSLSLDEDLINIRSKTVSSRPIKEELSDGAKAAIRYTNVLGLTAVVILYGLIRYFLRRKSRFADEL